jgi:hypothetical protein
MHLHPRVGERDLPAAACESPTPVFTLRWDEEARNWRSECVATTELPEEIRRVFEEFGYGCLAAETNIGVVHIIRPPLPWRRP